VEAQKYHEKNLTLGLGLKPVGAKVQIYVRDSNFKDWAASELKTVSYIVRLVCSWLADGQPSGQSNLKTDSDALFELTAVLVQDASIYFYAKARLWRNIHPTIN